MNTFPIDTQKDRTSGFTCVGAGNLCIDAVFRRDFPNGFGDKTGVTDTPVSQEVGGSMGNIMCNLAYLGWKTYPIAKLGPSRVALQILDDFHRYGVDTRLCTTDESGETYIYKAHHYFDADGKPEMKNGHIKIHPGRYSTEGTYSRFSGYKPIGVRSGDVEYMMERIDFTPTVYFFDSPHAGHREVALRLKERGTLIYFEPTNPNAPMLAKCMEMSDIIKVSRDNFPNLEQLVPDLSRKLVVQTMDSEGARFNLCGQGWVTVPPAKNDHVIDHEGAGDMTTSAFLNTLGQLDALSIDRMTPEKVLQALSHAMEYGSCCCSYLGAHSMWYDDPNCHVNPSTCNDLLKLDPPAVPVKKESKPKEKKAHVNTSIGSHSRLLGAIIGDIAGSIYEQAKHNVYSYEEAVLFPKGSKTRLTDDTVLTIAVARYLLEHDTLTLKGLTEMVHQYAKEHPLTIFMYGKPWGSMYGKGFQKWIDNPVPYQGETNGCAMRCTAVGWLCDSEEQVMEVAKFTADISHNSEAGEKATQAVSLCVFMARNGKSKEEIREAVRKRFGKDYQLDKSCDELREETRKYVKEKDHISALCTDSVPNAITAFLESKDYEDAIRLAISLGGDSDTIACICGGIAAAYYGEIPEWLVEHALKKLEEEPDFIEVVEMMDKAEPRHYTITD